ncbi:hypothetical protein [Cohnella panacarvi]|nr:hypothetical protein [Cohnella panacarvi]
MDFAVTPDDFGMFDPIAIHKQDESVVKTWLLYKLRTAFLRKTNYGT